MDQNPYSVGEHLTFGEASLQGRKFEAAVHGMQIIAAALIAVFFIFLGVVVGKNDGEVLGIQSPTFLLIALMIERHIVSLGVTLLLLGFMVFRFPTRRKVLWWVQDKLRELNM